jgi:hypothetical protein
VNHLNSIKKYIKTMCAMIVYIFEIILKQHEIFVQGTKTLPPVDLKPTASQTEDILDSILPPR